MLIPTLRENESALSIFIDSSSQHYFSPFLTLPPPSSIGSYAEAAQFYDRAADFLLAASREGALQSQRDALERSRTSYTARAQTLRQQMDGTAPLLPQPIGQSGGAFTKR